MVAHPGASPGADRLRPLSVPKPLEVRVDPAGRPAAVRWRGRWTAVAAIQDVWRIDDEWWREEIARRYYQLLLAGDRPLIVFHDLLANRWYTQSDLASTRMAAPLRPLVPAAARPSSRSGQWAVGSEQWEDGDEGVA